ncbi:hypothetical protein N4R57_19195 [Rhodobacteraceae bacterium D3-12]|nr:hypothetical protein N4R57_19195 [Rhodobacteraceae bacterium D3-12]
MDSASNGMHPVGNEFLLDRSAHQLAARSGLFEKGDPKGAITSQSFILRLNTIVSRQYSEVKRRIPASLSDAISASGWLNKYAELVAFGQWLLVDGHPGMLKKGGKQPNPHMILQSVAVALYELNFRPKLKEHGLAQAERKSRTREITKRDLAEQWRKLLGEKKEPSFFDSRLRSMKRILPAYLEHLESGHFVVDGKMIKKSPEIELVLKAITEKCTAGPETKIPAMTKPVTSEPADLSPFEIELRYSSPAQEEEYRNCAGASPPPPHLRYLPTATSSTSTSGAVRADLKDKIALVPDVAIRDAYKVVALIDRIVLLVNTATQTDYSALRMSIAKNAGGSPYVHDLTISQGEEIGVRKSRFQTCQRRPGIISQS